MALSSNGNGNVTRRTALKVTSTSSLLAVAGGIPANAADTNFQGKSGKIVPIMLRRDIVNVAAVQSDSAHLIETKDTEIFERIVTGVNAVQAQCGVIDLIAFHETVIQDRHVSGPRFGALLDCAKHFDCYLSFGVRVMDGELPAGRAVKLILIEPSGQMIWAEGPTPVLHATDIGTLALVSGAQSPESIATLSAAGAEIMVRSIPVGYPRWDMQAASAYNAVYSVVVTPTQPAADQAASATSIFDPKGEVMTETGAQWEQTVSAALPIAALRSNRALTSKAQA